MPSNRVGRKHGKFVPCEHCELHVKYLEDQIRILEKQSRTDSLTGLGNRRAFEARLSDDFARAQRDIGKPLVLITSDIDRFKHINDTYGHAKGDDVLRQFSAHLRHGTRAIDFVGRYGGEEFVILMPGLLLVNAARVVERIRSTIERELVVSPGVSVTASFGIAQWDEKEDGKSLFDRADKALYAAKKGGRNRVVIAR